ncbi:MAG: Do family serine endopeptidase [Pseudomonadota bacterium]
MKRLLIAIAALTIGFSANAWAALPATLNGQQLPTLAPLVKEVSPAVVNIQVRGTTTSQRRNRRDPFREFFGTPNAPTERQTRSAGSGVIVDADNGYILTNHHVIANADQIDITLQDGRQISAEVVGSDEGTDVAVLKVTEKDLKDISLGDSDATEVGDFVIAIGNPFGLEHTVTSGIVSALGRSGIGSGYEDFIQTDASINPGNSGGALVNLAGELVGINSAIISGSGGNVGIGFAIPSNMAQAIMRQILEFGEVRRGLLGVSIDTVNASAAEALGLKNVTGALIQSVNPGSAAERAGIEVNDIITAVNGEKVDSASELRNAIGLLRSGETVAITALRDGSAREFTATLDELGMNSIANAAQIHPGLAGAVFNNADGNEGVIASEVAEGSPAHRQGLRAGDSIVSVNRQRVSTVEDLNNMSSSFATSLLFVEIERNGRRLLLKFTP